MSSLCCNVEIVDIPEDWLEIVEDNVLLELKAVIIDSGLKD